MLPQARSCYGLVCHDRGYRLSWRSPCNHSRQCNTALSVQAVLQHRLAEPCMLWHMQSECVGGVGTYTQDRFILASLVGTRTLSKDPTHNQTVHSVSKVLCVGNLRLVRFTSVQYCAETHGFCGEKRRGTTCPQEARYCDCQGLPSPAN